MRLKVLAVLGLAALAGCSPAGHGSPASGKTVIRFATDWRAEAEHGGFYEALATGEYAKRGLDVRIIEGGPTVDVEQLIASGAVELGDGSNSFVVSKLVDVHAPIKAVAAFMQKDPQVLLAHPDAGINAFADMKGHPILLSDESKTAFWPWMKAKYGFSDDQVRSYTFNNAPFILDKRAVQEGYLTSEPYTIAKQGGFTPKVFLLADQGYSSYAAMVLAPTSLIAKDPAAIKAFVEASAIGWREYLHGDPRPADALIMKDNPDMTEDVLAQARDKMRQYGLVDSGDVARLGYGAMTARRWADFFTIADKTPGAYKDAFTTQFLPNPPVK
ncbi:MAG TPA: ABC transporter substrate-binding protein [Caulobacteraceae bacterium]|nr:ABC transporter substrate-binding protein [Caulobacteraceae bacterium]